MVATVNLSKLGWAANTKRLFGKCNQILVMELPDELAPAIGLAAQQRSPSL